jgi:hypothetical protein
MNQSLAALAGFDALKRTPGMTLVTKHDKSEETVRVVLAERRKRL